MSITQATPRLTPSTIYQGPHQGGKGRLQTGQEIEADKGPPLLDSIPPGSQLPYTGKSLWRIWSKREEGKERSKGHPKEGKQWHSMMRPIQGWEGEGAEDKCLCINWFGAALYLQENRADM